MLAKRTTKAYWPTGLTAYYSLLCSNMYVIGHLSKYYAFPQKDVVKGMGEKNLE